MFFMLYILNNHMERNHWVKTLLYCTQLFYVLEHGLKYMIHSKVTSFSLTSYFLQYQTMSHMLYWVGVCAGGSERDLLLI